MCLNIQQHNMSPSFSPLQSEAECWHGYAQVQPNDAIPGSIQT